MAPWYIRLHVAFPSIDVTVKEIAMQDSFLYISKTQPEAYQPSI